MTNTKTLVILFVFMVKIFTCSQACLIHQRHPVDGFLMVPARPVILLSAMEQIPRRTPSAKGAAKMRSSWKRLA